MSNQRKVWTTTVEAGDEYGVGPVEVMVEQFDDKPPSVAFRRDRWATWSRAFSTEVAP